MDLPTRERTPAPAARPEDIVRRRRQLQFIKGLIEETGRESDLAGALRRMLRRFCRQFRAGAGAVFLRGPQGWQLKVWRAGRNADRAAVKAIEPERFDPDGRLAAGLALAWRGRLAGEPEDGDWVGVPCMADDTLVGAIFLGRFGGRPLDGDELSLLRSVSREIGGAIRVARLLDLVIQGKRDWEQTFDAITDMIMILDARCRIVRANRSLADRFGLEIGQLPGVVCRELFGYEIRRCRGCAVRASQRTGEPKFEERDEATLRALLQVSAYPRFDAAGRYRGCVVVYREVSEERRLREQLRIMDKMSSLGQLVGGIAHELNNPIQSVMVFSQLLLEDDLAPKQRKLVEKIYADGVRCAKIVQSLAATASSQTGQRVATDLHEVIHHAVMLKSYELEEHGIRSDLELEAPACTVLGDAFRLRQLFLNVLANAVEAIQEAPGGWVRVSSRNVGGRVRVTVADSGRGIAPEHLPRVFDPFFSTRNGASLGLGLSAAYGIVKEHGGEIHVTSENREGTSVQVELPVYTGTT